ncbi:MAG: hypothetical protein IPJ98_28350 [Bryobacterales bacterium]|nr:hypothetical protein [Bryobacterales bacterium]
MDWAWEAHLCLRDGLMHTNMDNRFAFGVILLDLAIIAFGGGAFFLRRAAVLSSNRKNRNAVIRSAVLIGFLCYSGAVERCLSWTWASRFGPGSRSGIRTRIRC